jgi:hypothetical protein
MAKLDDFIPQNLTNTVWALGDLEYRNDAVSAALYKASMPGSKSLLFHEWYLNLITGKLLGINKSKAHK